MWAHKTLNVNAEVLFKYLITAVMKPSETIKIADGQLYSIFKIISESYFCISET